MRNFIILFSLIFSLKSFALTYEYKDFNLQLKDSWSVLEGSPKELEAVLFPLPNKNSDHGAVIVKIESATNGNPGLLSLLQRFNKENSDKNIDKKSISIINRGPFTAGSNKGFYIEYQLRAGTDLKQNMWVMFPHNKKNYFFIYIAPQKVYQSTRSEVLEVIKSLKFNQ